MYKKLSLWGMGFWLMLLLQGCADSIVAANPVPAEPIADPALPVGVYRTELLIAPIGNLDNETWHLQLKDNGHYSLILFDTQLFEGEYWVKANKIEFSDEAESLSCSSSDEPMTVGGSYSWSLDGQLLILNKIADACSLRGIVLTSRPLLVQ